MGNLAADSRDFLLEEANRCLKCKKPRCKKACPISTEIPLIMELFLAGKEQEAGEILFENNPLSAVCSIVCPHETNCYGNCVLGLKQKPVSFYQIEQYLSGKAQIATTLRGLFVVDENGMTNIPGVFAAGDVVSGPKTVVEAVVYTKKVAENLERYCLEKQGRQPE